jgi:uncharacterized protein YegP (UPF0339 family)
VIYERETERRAMTDQHEIHATQKAKYEEKARCLKSFVKELTDVAAKNGTDSSLIEEDLMKAQGDIEFYECELERMAQILAKEATRAEFHVYKDAAGEWRWRLIAGNKQIVADSGEGYEHRRDCLHGIELVKGSKDAPVKDGK